MNPLGEFLVHTHYYSLVDKIAFVVIVILPVWIRNWDREALSVYLILFGFYMLEISATAVVYIVPVEVGNSWFYNIIQVAQLGITLYYFSDKLKSKRHKYFFHLTYILFLISHISITTLIAGWLQLDIFALVPMTAIVGLAALDFLRESLAEVEDRPIYSPVFWFACATVISNFGSVPITSLYFRIASFDIGLANQIWHINDVLYGLWFLIPAIGLVWISRKTIPSYS